MRRAAAVLLVAAALVRPAHAGSADALADEIAGRVLGALAPGGPLDGGTRDVRVSVRASEARAASLASALAGLVTARLVGGPGVGAVGSEDGAGYEVVV